MGMTIQEAADELYGWLWRMRLSSSVCIGVGSGEIHLYFFHKVYVKPNLYRLKKFRGFPVVLHSDCSMIINRGDTA